MECTSRENVSRGGSCCCLVGLRCDFYIVVVVFVVERATSWAVLECHARCQHGQKAINLAESKINPIVE